MNKIYNFLFIILFLPIFLFSDNFPTTPVKLISKDTATSTESSIEQMNTEVSTQVIEDQIDAQRKLLDEIIENINNESYLTTLPKKNFYENEILFLSNRINTNSIQNYSLAVKRDELKVAYLKEKAFYENTLKEIIIAKQEFRNKQYFDVLLQNNINFIQDFNLVEYTVLYQTESKNQNKISVEYTNNYIELYNQKHTQLFALQYLYANIQKIRSSNFFIDEFNLKYSTFAHRFQ